jgi:hypothetical protein
MDATPIEHNPADSAEVSRNKSRSDWMTIMGVIGLVALVCASIWAVGVARQFRENPLVQSLAAMAPQIDEMKDMTQSQIQAQAASVTADELIADPRGYEGRYVVVDGVASEEESAGVIQNIALNSFGHTDFTGMVLNEGIVLIDITGSTGFLHEGTPVRGFGKVLVARTEDFFNIPVVGPDLRREFGDAQGMANEVVFLISNGIETGSIPAEAQIIGSR